jgi:hypothetical protein
LCAVVAVAGAALALVQSHVQPRVQTDRDLDGYSDEQLETDLADELDDIFAELGGPDAQYALDDLKTAILDALGDEGDEGDEEEMEIDLADLNAEMAEAGTTLDDVVDEALAEADRQASRRASPSWTVVHVTSSAVSPSFTFDNAGLRPNAQDRRPGFTTARVAVNQVKDRTIAAIRATNRRGG